MSRQPASQMDSPTDRRIDGQMDGRTDRQTDQQTKNIEKTSKYIFNILKNLSAMRHINHFADWALLGGKKKTSSSPGLEPIL